MRAEDKALIEALKELTGYDIVTYANPWKYRKHMKAHFGEKYDDPTDSGYPTFLAMGWCSHSKKEIVVLRCFNWKQRLIHEIGHTFRIPHTMERGNIMHPWGIMRGWKGTEEFLSTKIMEKI